MSDVQFYIRIRGTVLGPYDQEKLQALARRGQLSRMHEISPDGVTWSRAANFPDLFARAAERPGGEAESVAVAAQAQPVPAEMRVASPSAPPSRKWFYNLHGTEHGPIDLATLQQLLATGQLDSDDMIWGEHMPAWLPAKHVPELATVVHIQVAEPRKSEGLSTSTDQIPVSLCRVAVAARPWVLFLAITAFVMAALLLFGGMGMLIRGAHLHLSPVVASGLFSLIEAVVAAVAGMYLASYASYLYRLQHSHASIVLEKALEVLCHFWIYLAVVFIVCLTLLLLGIIVIISTGVSFPW